MPARLKIGIIGAHNWAEKAHLPGYLAHPDVEIAAICDIERDRAERLAAQFGAAAIYTDHRAMLADPSIAMVDVCTPTATHLPLSLDVIAAGKHVMSEKPLHTQSAPAFDAAARAQAAGVRTKLGFTFRYSPAIRKLKGWIDAGALGEIFHVHGLEQNSQFLDPDFPLRQFDIASPRDRLIPASIVGYGSHLVDLMRWLGGEFGAVASSMANFVPERLVRGLEGRQCFQVEDATVALVEYRTGAQGMMQTSYVAVGNYPGIEIRVYGSKGAAVARLVTEGGVAETLTRATTGDVEFRPVAIGQADLPPGTTLTTPWPELYFRNLIRFFVDEIVEDRPEECTFRDGAESQRIVDAIVAAHLERRWVEVDTA